MNKFLFSFILAMVMVFFSNASFAEEKLPENQLMIQLNNSEPLIAKRIIFLSDCVIAQLKDDHRTVIRPHESVRVLYTDENGLAKKVYINKKDGYILVDDDVMPFPAKLVHINEYNPYIDY